jgi:hypothetical protein
MLCTLPAKLAVHLRSCRGTSLTRVCVGLVLGAHRSTCPTILWLSVSYVLLVTKLETTLDWGLMISWMLSSYFAVHVGCGNGVHGPLPILRIRVREQPLDGW